MFFLFKMKPDNERNSEKYAIGIFTATAQRPCVVVVEISFLREHLVTRGLQQLALGLGGRRSGRCYFLRALACCETRRVRSLLGTLFNNTALSVVEQ